LPGAAHLGYRNGMTLSIPHRLSNASAVARISPLLVWMIAASLCLTAACAKAPEKPAEPAVRQAPASDVPVYEPHSQESRDAGEGGYRIAYSSQSNLEAVVAFYDSEWPKAGWIRITEVVEDANRSLRYYRKDNRLLMLILENVPDDMGCKFTVMETEGEAPRGNILSHPEGAPIIAEPSESQPSEAHAPAKGH
jgi:hypothetical protein